MSGRSASSCTDHSFGDHSFGSRFGPLRNRSPVSWVADLFVTDRYMLLCGYPPFPGDGAEAIANVQSGKYSFPEK